MVEEPPPSTVFVMLADTVPPEIITIASRCVPVEFGPLPSLELERALVAEGADAERASVAAMAAGGDVDRARLLVTDDALAERAALWQSIPDELNGTGSRACELVDQVRAGMDAAQGPLDARQATEIEQLEARVEQLGERGSGRADLVAQHKREVRRLRTDELTFGLAVMSRVYRDRLVAGYDPAAESAIAGHSDRRREPDPQPQRDVAVAGSVPQTRSGPGGGPDARTGCRAPSDAVVAGRPPTAAAHPAVDDSYQAANTSEVPPSSPVSPSPCQVGGRFSRETSRNVPEAS